MTGLPILFKLLIAHFAGDFLLQNSWIVENRNKRIFSVALLYHLLIHLGCLLVLFLFDIDWRIVMVILLSHGIIDLGKAAFEIRLNRLAAQEKLDDTDRKLQSQRLYVFIIDQILHVFVIAVAWLIITGQAHLVNDLVLPDHWWLIALAYLLITKPAGILIGKLVKRWYDRGMQTEPAGDQTGLGGLPNAGTWIGIIERILILSFILINSFEAIGFLLAAKSILRIGDLKEDKEHKKTEYILIGTLLSFGITIVLGLVVRFVNEII
ncbi:MAG TPA: DUF3307 domain-containing protein [Sphingobacteriaceae bacterium]